MRSSVPITVSPGTQPWWDRSPRDRTHATSVPAASPNSLDHRLPHMAKVLRVAGPDLSVGGAQRRLERAVEAGCVPLAPVSSRNLWRSPRRRPAGPEQPQRGHVTLRQLVQGAANQLERPGPAMTPTVGARARASEAVARAKGPPPDHPVVRNSRRPSRSATCNAMPATEVRQNGVSVEAPYPGRSKAMMRTPAASTMSSPEYSSRLELAVKVKKRRARVARLTHAKTSPSRVDPRTPSWRGGKVRPWSRGSQEDLRGPGPSGISSPAVNAVQVEEPGFPMTPS